MDYDTKRNTQIASLWGAYFLLPWVSGWLCYLGIKALGASRSPAMVAGAATALIVLVLVALRVAASRRSSRKPVVAATVTTAEQATTLALDYLRQENGKAFVAVFTEERQWGWYVETQTEEYARTQDRRFSIPGHGPLAVLRSGTIRPFPSLPISRAAFERELESQGDTR